MDHFALLILIGLILGTIGTLIGAGGGFILMPLLLLTQRTLPPAVITAISTAIVAANAVSGSVAYIIDRRVDYKAGLVFALCAVPGAILGPLTTDYIPHKQFNIVFGIFMVLISLFLFFRTRGNNSHQPTAPATSGSGLTHQRIVDKSGAVYEYSYNMKAGAGLSLGVGYLASLLGIGGGIIHVPAMAKWLKFPVHIATATSHFVLALTMLLTTAEHLYKGHYNDPAVQKMVFGLGIGVVVGAQLGARLSRKVKDNAIIKALAVCLGVVGVRLLFTAL